MNLEPMNTMADVERVNGGLDLFTILGLLFTADPLSPTMAEEYKQTLTAGRGVGIAVKSSSLEDPEVIREIYALFNMIFPTKEILDSIPVEDKSIQTIMALPTETGVFSITAKVDQDFFVNTIDVTKLLADKPELARRLHALVSDIFFCIPMEDVLFEKEEE